MEAQDSIPHDAAPLGTMITWFTVMAVRMWSG